MKLLSLECSAGPASAAIWQDGKILASSFVNVKLTHSQTLMPMVESLLTSSRTGIEEIDGIAVTSGPGSFTGIRIGISAAKGLAMPGSLPCVGVSTLYAVAHNFIGTDCLVCAVMDARCQQVYHALFDVSGGEVTRLSEDEAVDAKKLAEKLKKVSQKRNKRVIIAGDGAEVFFPFAAEVPLAEIAPEKDRFQNAVSVALAAAPLFAAGQAVTAEELLPFYLRLPQAERERNARLLKENAKGETV